jgi:hypothetical protein
MTEPNAEKPRRRRGKKESDPGRVAMHEKLAQAQADFERWYGRLKRAFNAMEKAKSRVQRLRKKLDALDREGA